MDVRKLCARLVPQWKRKKKNTSVGHEVGGLNRKVLRTFFHQQ